MRGAALVEFALCLPLLTVVVLGTLDLGRAFVTYEQLKNAAREGAVYARDYPYQQVDDGSGICTAPRNITYHSRAEVGGAPLTVSVVVGGVAGTPATGSALGCDTTDSPPGPGTAVTVTATKPFTLLTPFVQTFVNVTSLSASVTVRETR